MTKQDIIIDPAAVMGAVISGINLANGFNDKVVCDIHNALIKHQVLFFHNQEITENQHLAFSRLFGELHIHPFAVGTNGGPMMVLENNQHLPPNLNHWHSDLTCLEKPPLGTIMHATAVPDSGGDTIWANMYDAYDALSEKIQNFLSGLMAEHQWARQHGPRVKSQAGAIKLAQFEKKYPPVVHPVVRTHPVSGRKGLFVNHVFTERVLDMTDTESDTLLDFLYRHIATPEFHVRFKWHKGSIAFWDNRCTQHYAVADYYPQLRRMNRVTICGDKPF